MKAYLIYLVTALTSVTMTFAAEVYTYEDLVRQLTDLQQPAFLPEKGEKCVQWSSYDRNSRYDAEQNKYIAWDANGDGDGIIRKENGDLVLAEIEGPGCIRRIWSALAEDGHIKVYLDGQTEPAIDLPFKGYFNLENAPFTRPALVHQVARGCNNYTPIPFQKSCKIVAEPGWGRYYQFTYTVFPEDTKVPTFSMELSESAEKVLDQANALLTDPLNEKLTDYPREQTVWKTIKVAPNQTVNVLNLKGTRAITSLRAKIELPESPADIDLLRELSLQIHWDGERNPSVWAPFGDFFGTAAGANAYTSLPCGLTEDGWWYSQWYMPFTESAEISVENTGDKPRKITFSISHAPIGEQIDLEQLGRFHAKWHRDAFLPDDPNRRIDWTLLKTKGRGRFCGVMLHVWNPRGSWWGEGDEKFFVDGEKFPSTFGTGSEDYFGYAWCDPTLFENAFHNQTISMGNKGHISVNRWQIADNIPFQDSFEGYIEKYYPNDRPTLYASTVFWYLNPNGTDPYKPRPVSERTGYYGPIKVFKIKNALEGENLEVIERTGGNTSTQGMINFTGQWSGDAQLWWTGAKPDDKLSLRFNVPKQGDYTVLGRFTKARDYGITSVFLDGAETVESLDLYNSEVIPSKQIVLGKTNLPKGSHTLTFEIIGANDKAIKSYMLGLDCIILKQTD